jgi:hypothetical protein
VALAIGVMDGLLDAADFEVAGVAVVKDVFEDFMACDWLSDEFPANEDVVGD